MNPFSLGEAAAACGGAYTGDAALLAAPVKDVCIDSRRATPGALYVPIIGQVHDGHAFIDGARRGGALCTLTDRPLPEGPYIRVPDTLEALQKLAAFYRCRFDIPVIGVTGSVGKTSTKEMLAAVLSSRFRTFKTPGNLNNQTGVPLTLFRLEPEHELAIIEMGTNHPGEIRRLSAMAQPTICLITNVGVAHIEFFGTRENIFRGKGVLGLATGSQALYDWLDENPGVIALPIAYVNDPAVISQMDNFISLNSCVSVDLYGQVSSESAGLRQISGTGGQVDFLTGAAMSRGGKAFICVASSRVGKDGVRRSNIVPHFNGEIITSPRAQAYYIATENGVVNLAGRSAWERAEGLIGLAHPDFREELIRAAEEQRIWRRSNRR